MSFESKIDYWIDRIRIQWKGMGILKYLPLFINYIIIPISVWIYMQVDPEYYMDYFVEQLVFFVPLLAVWWELLLMQQYIEGEGRELLWIEKSSKIADTLLYLFFYLLTLIPIFLFIINNIPYSEDLMIVLLFQSFMFSGCFYMLSMVCASVSVGFVVVFIYALFSGNRISTIVTALGFEGMQSSLFYLTAGVLFFAIGEVYHRGREKRM